MNFSDRLKEARKNAGLTQAQLSEKLGITAQSYSQYETGKRNPKMETLQKIAAALNIKLSELVPISDTLDWAVEKIEENRITREYSALDAAIKENIDKMNESAKKKVYDYTEDLIQNPQNWEEKQ